MAQEKPVSVRLLQIASPDHLALWNALSIETLAGDLDGAFGQRVDVRIARLRPDQEVDDVLEGLRRAPVQLLGISVEIGSLERTELLLQGLQSAPRSERPLIVLGGQLPTYFPEHFLARAPGALAVIGEGEEALRGIVEHIEAGRPLDSIPNLVFRCASSGELQRTVERTPALERLVHPPRVDTVEEVLQHGGNALLESSRGCSWSNCSYCTVRSFRKGRKWEGFPVGRVLHNIERLVDKGVFELNFGEDEFIGGPDPENIRRIHELADGIERIGRSADRQVTFRIFVIPHTVFRSGRGDANEAVKRLIARLREVGLAKVYIGVESGCPTQARRYGRGCRLEEVEQSIRVIRDELRLPLDVGFIMFDPELTLEELIANVEFFRRWDLIKCNQWPFRHLAVNIGSRLHRRLEERGLVSEVDLNYMSCKYRYSDRQVARISSIVSSISIPPGPVFFALKAISKRQFDPGQKDTSTVLAQRHVEANGAIYLDLMERLARLFLATPDGDPQPIVDATRDRVDDLVRRVHADIRAGRIVDDGAFVANKIAAYLRGEVRDFVT